MSVLDSGRLANSRLSGSILTTEVLIEGENKEDTILKPYTQSKTHG